MSMLKIRAISPRNWMKINDEDSFEKRQTIFGTWNIQSIATKQTELFKELNGFKLDMIASSETKKKDIMMDKIENYDIKDLFNIMQMN